MDITRGVETVSMDAAAKMEEYATLEPEVVIVQLENMESAANWIARMENLARDVKIFPSAKITYRSTWKPDLVVASQGTLDRTVRKSVHSEPMESVVHIDVSAGPMLKIVIKRLDNVNASLGSRANIVRLVAKTSEPMATNVWKFAIVELE